LTTDKQTNLVIHNADLSRSAVDMMDNAKGRCPHAHSYNNHKSI